MTSSALDYDLAAPGVHHVVEHADVRLLRDLLEQVSAIEGDPGRVGKHTDAERIDQLRLLDRINATAASRPPRPPATPTGHRRRRGCRRRSEPPRSRLRRAVSRRCAIDGRPHLAFSHA
jgi:hypothetical protein